MTIDQADASPSSVQAVTVYDGQVLLVRRQGDWSLPAGTPEPAETPEATAARVVYELTGYLVDGSQTLRDTAPAAVVCQLLTESPSGGAALAPEQIRWTAIEQAAGTGLPEAVRTYLLGHRPV
ncbi:NUDIX domain-containing protein [Streptomyces sp. NPDC096205]|uniref:NUDIX domain-containing protein n=1 Tax=Streptomyces sp. NPDC096205 TaxID=3366081 RepID=UPI0038209CDC